MEEGIWPFPWKRIEMVLKTFGGWSRMFRKSAITYDAEVIIHSDADPGFWIEWAKARAEEYFREEVNCCVKVLRKEHGDERSKTELETLVAKALLQEGWKPPKTKILNEARALRKQRKGEIACLRKSIRRK